MIFILGRSATDIPNQSSIKYEKGYPNIEFTRPFITNSHIILDTKIVDTTKIFVNCKQWFYSIFPKIVNINHSLNSMWSLGKHTNFTNEPKTMEMDIRRAIWMLEM